MIFTLNPSNLKHWKPWLLIVEETASFAHFFRQLKVVCVSKKTYCEFFPFCTVSVQLNLMTDFFPSLIQQVPKQECFHLKSVKCWIVWQTKRSFLFPQNSHPYRSTAYGNVPCDGTMKACDYSLLWCQDFNVVQPRSPLWKWQALRCIMCFSLEIPLNEEAVETLCTSPSKYRHNAKCTANN